MKTTTTTTRMTRMTAKWTHSSQKVEIQCDVKLGVHSMETFADFLFLLFLIFISTNAQTEGDPGYDYESYESYDDNAVIGFDPNFDSLVANVTVIKLQTVILPCSIEYLGKYKVAWLDANSMTITYEDRRIIDDSRFSIIRSSLKEWNLQIREVRREDEGQYRCTINTNPVKFKEITLRVKVPATIREEFSSGNLTVTEGRQVILVCNATGTPMPHVTWTMRSNKVSLVRNRKACKFKTTNGAGAFGSTLIIPNVTRHCHDIFECTANNGIPPVSSRQMKLTVEFAPQVYMANSRILQDLGRETILECTITAFPHAVNYWERNGHRVSSSMKHRIEAYKEGDQIVILSLKIVITDDSDFGEYRCKAANWLGKDEKSMQLLEATKSKTTLKLQATKTTTKTYHITPKLAHRMDTTSAPAINIFRLEKQTGNIMYRNGGLCLEFPFWAKVIQIAAYIFWISNFQ